MRDCSLNPVWQPASKVTPDVPCVSWYSCPHVIPPRFVPGLVCVGPTEHGKSDGTSLLRFSDKRLQFLSWFLSPFSLALGATIWWAAPRRCPGAGELKLPANCLPRELRSRSRFLLSSSLAPAKSLSAISQETQRQNHLNPLFLHSWMSGML